MRPARLCRAIAAPIWFGRAPSHAAVISCCVLPVARARTWSLRLGELRLPPAGFAVVITPTPSGRLCSRGRGLARDRLSCPRALTVADEHTLRRLQFAELAGELVALRIDAPERL